MSLKAAGDTVPPQSSESVSSPSPVSENLPLISVIVLNYQGKQFISACLESILQCGYPRLEVIVVDNGSTDGSMALAREFGDRVICIENGRNLGFSAGCNVGIRRSTGEIVILLNVDTRVDPGWAGALVDSLQKNADAALAGSKLYFEDGRTIQHAGGVVEPNGLCRHRGYNEIDRGQFNEICEVDYLSGASLAIRRRVLDEIGLLDERFFFYYDDVDLASEVKKRGYRAIFVPASTAFHYETFGLKKRSFTYFYRFHRGRLLYILKHFGPRYFLTVFLRAEWDWFRRSDFTTQAPGLIAAYLSVMPSMPHLWFRGWMQRSQA